MNVLEENAKGLKMENESQKERNLLTQDLKEHAFPPVNTSLYNEFYNTTVAGIKEQEC